MLTRIARVLARKRVRAWAGTLAVLVFLSGVVILGVDRAHQPPLVRLHSGAAWLASSKVGQLTLLDGSSAEVAAQVPVAEPGSPIRAAQLGSTGYALNRWDGSVIRVDGATLQPGRAMNPLAVSGEQLTAFPTSHTLYVLDGDRGLLAPVDPVGLTPRGTPQSLAAQVTPDGSAVDDNGRLWVLDHRTGDLVWFAADVRHARTHAGTPERTRLALTGGQPALLDPVRRVAELLDPDTGEVVDSLQADLRPQDSIAVSGSPQQRRLLVTVPSRGLLMVCDFGGDACAPPIPLGSGGSDLGAAIETSNHAIVPDYATGRVWVVDLATMRVVFERQLFPSPIRFELVTRDGVIFYNDPDSDQAGVLDLDGRVRAVSKYDPNNARKVHPTQNGNNQETPHQGPRTPAPSSPGAPPVAGPDPGGPDLPERPPATAIVIKPRDRGLVGEEFEITVVAPEGLGIGSARWTFGDGTEAGGETVRHRWDRPGEFQVNVAATFRDGRPAPVATATVTIEPAGTPPRIARLSIRPETPRVGQQTWFSADVTGAAPVSWDWRITGPATVGSDRPEFQQTFTAPGTYTVTLTVAAGAARAQQSRQFTVAPAPPPVKCGATLTASAVLTEDLVCQGEVGITIGASNVVLDLGGHTLSSAAPTMTGAGIDVNGQFTNTIITNGRVMHFRHGIRLIGVTGVTITNVTSSSQSDQGFDFADYGADIFTDNAVDVQLNAVRLSGSYAFSIQEASTVRMTGTTVDYHSNPESPISVGRCVQGSRCTFTGSTLRMSGFTCQFIRRVPGSVFVADTGSNVWIENFNRDCETVAVSNSTVRTNGLIASDVLVFTGNTMIRAAGTPEQTGPTFTSGGTFEITGNTFAGFMTGLSLEGVSGSVVRNTFRDNTMIGMRLGSDTGGTAEGPVEINGNTFARNGGGPETGPDVEGGLVVHRDADDQLVTISNNHTESNQDYGIWATGNVTGGGNTTLNDKIPCAGSFCS